MKTTKAKSNDSQLKNSLRQLRKLGLYNPKNPRKNPTRYGKELVKKFSDVLGPKPRAEVIKIPASAVGPLKQQFKTKRSKKGGVAVVPKAAGMKATFSKRDNTIIRRVGDYKMVPYSDAGILMRGEFPTLKRGQAVAVRIGNNYKMFYSLDEVRAAMAEYSPSKTTLWQYPYISTRKAR